VRVDERVEVLLGIGERDLGEQRGVCYAKFDPGVQAEAPVDELTVDGEVGVGEAEDGGP
jgi:hypothetical protein